MPTTTQQRPAISNTEVQRRYKDVRDSMRKHELDALVVCGNEYTGFEGAVRYISGFEIVHRYVYALLPLDEEPTLVFPREARWIGDKAKPWVKQHVWAELPGKWLREQFEAKRWKRIGVYGTDFILTVRDYRALSGGSFEIVPFDQPFDLVRAVKSGEELACVRDSMEIIADGFWALVAAYEPGKTEAEIMAPAVERFFARGAGLRMMNIILSGTGGEAEAHFKVPGHRVVGPDDLLLYSLEITGTDGYWVEFSRPLIRGKISARTAAMSEAYPEALEAARKKMREGEVASEVHRACAEIFKTRGFQLGHLSGHSIGTTMIEYPSIGAESDVELKEGMIFSLHPQVVDADGKVCLYTQDTYRVEKNEGQNLSNIGWSFFRGGETPR